MSHFLKRAFTKVNSREYFLINDILAFFTILSILGIVLETVPSLHAYGPLFVFVEWSAVLVFSGEYVARLLYTKPWHSYSFSFFGLIDLISVVPTYLGLGNWTFLKSARVLRIIRFLRMVRLAKIIRIRGKDPEESLGVVGINVAIFLATLFLASLILGTLLYFVEGSNDSFQSIPHGMYWTFKVFVGGLPVDAPHSVAGQVIHVATRFVGLLVFGVLIGIIGNIFRHFLLGTKK